MISGPGAAGACEGLVLDGAQSTGGGGRPLAYAWTATACAREVATSAASALRLSSETLEAAVSVGCRSIVARLSVENFLGGASPVAEFVATLSGDAVPSVAIVDGPRRVTRDAAARFEAYGAATTCDGRRAVERGVDYGWRVTRGDGVVVPLASTSVDPRTFALDAYSLDAATTYDVVATVRDRVLNLSSSASIRVDVARGAVVAAIVGGDRDASSASPTVLDADCRDVDDPGATLAYAWACDGSPCPPRGADGFGTAASAVFDLKTPGDAVASVVATAADGRNASASVALRVRADDHATAPTVLVGAVTRLGSSYVVSGSAELASTSGAEEPPRALALAWDVVESPLLDLASAARSPLQVETRGGASRVDVSLVLDAAALVPRATYVFRLSAATPEGVAASARAVVAVPAAPTGSVAVAPEAGDAVATVFDVVATDWASDAYPLRYAFGASRGVADAAVFG